MPITKATAAAMSPLTKMERRMRGGRRENQPRAALMRPARLSRRSGRPGIVSGSAERPAFHRFLRSCSFRGALRTLLVALSRYALRIADPPVMIMAVSAAPRRGPANPKREVTNADRKSAVSGKRVDLGGRRIIKKK